MGELSAEWYGGDRTNDNINQPGFQTDTVNFAKLMAGVAAAITGGDAEAINLAAAAGGNAAEKNYLLHYQKQDWATELADCKARGCSQQQLDAINARYAKLDAQQDKSAERCIGEVCVPITEELQKDIQDKTEAIVAECGLGPTLCATQYTNEINHESNLLNGTSGTSGTLDRTDAISSLGTLLDEYLVYPYLDMREENLNTLNSALLGDTDAAIQVGLGLVGSIGSVGRLGTVANDGIATWVRVPGTPNAVVRIEQTSSGLNVTDIYSAGLPSGSGSQLLAEGLTSSGLQSGSQFSITGIINQPTLAAFNNGVAASDSLLGKVALNALYKMGLQPASIQYQVVRDKLNILVKVK